MICFSHAFSPFLLPHSEIHSYQLRIFPTGQNVALLARSLLTGALDSRGAFQWRGWGRRRRSHLLFTGGDGLFKPLPQDRFTVII